MLTKIRGGFNIAAFLSGKLAGHSIYVLFAYIFFPSGRTKVLFHLL